MEISSQNVAGGSLVAGGFPTMGRRSLIRSQPLELSRQLIMGILARLPRFGDSGEPARMGSRVRYPDPILVHYDNYTHEE